MTIVRVGSTEKYAEGWDKAFGRSRGPKVAGTAKKSEKKAAPKKAAAKKAAPKKSPAKKAGKKS